MLAPVQIFNRTVTKAAVIATLFLVSFASHASNRHALVVGNSNYASAALENPRNDATDMAFELKKLGYKVHRGKALLDLDLGQFENEITEFALDLPRNAIAVVYYAGHGISTQSDNYLIPVKASIRWEEQLRDRAVSLRAVQELLSKHNDKGLNAILLDACRDNPLEKQFGRSLSRGLRPIGVVQGNFIGYAADRGQIAADGQGRNGVYTGELLRELRENPGLDITVLHNRVAASVYEKTRGSANKQIPVSEQKIRGEFCFGICSTGVAGFKFEVVPEQARVCFHHNGEWNCDRGARLPVSNQYPVHVSAEGHADFTGVVKLNRNRQLFKLDLTDVAPVIITDAESKPRDLVVEDESIASTEPALVTTEQPRSTATYAIWGGLAVAALAAILSSSSDGDGEDSDTFTLNLPNIP